MSTLRQQDEQEKLKKGKAIMNTTYESMIVNRDFEVVQLHQIKDFKDHKGNLVTKSGYLIDDYQVDKEKSQQ